MLVDAIVLLVVGAVALLLPSFGPYRAHLRRAFARKAGAQVPADQEARLEARLGFRSRGAGMGILLAGLVALVLARTWEGADQAAGGFFVLSVMFVVGAAGAALADLARPGVLAEGPRTARATTPTLEDYLPPYLRTLGRGFVGLGMVALVGALLLGGTEWFDAGTVLLSPVPVLAVGIPVVVLLSWLATRRVLDSPQPARDEVELYWQDAVRADTLSSLSMAAPILSLLALAATGNVLDDAASTAAVVSGQIGPGWSLAVLVAGYLLPVVLVGVALLVAAGPGRRTEAQHVRDRLWGGRAPTGDPHGAGA
ncbi:hypothetical protein [Ornithinimicrobium avium]|uniref:Uncharacterized protein n=1 Tax=Ornithinimicrobium avium TaxID=2283195 RepID=A0A345NL26_9MICO|nr:hypothetical protein [Ornithinimicrobium avium]AXH95734.1 hypothetical protein DV701_05985 [Ornithinimicrobium avium]